MSVTRYIPSTYLLMLATLPYACGNPGKSGSSPIGAVVNVTGTIASQSGKQEEMASWVIALYEKDTGATRVATVDGAGQFELKAVPTGKAFGVFLLSPSYIVQSVFGHPHSTATDRVHPYFRITGLPLPRLLHKGPVVQAQQTTNLALSSDVVADANQNQIPDGAESLLTSVTALTSSKSLKLTEDLDGDGTSNLADSDLDGDGLPNTIDADDDNDGIRDIFDADSNGDAQVDVVQGANDQYFGRSEVEWIAVRYELAGQDDGSVQRSLTLLTKLANTAAVPSQVRIVGAQTLLDGASIAARNADNTTTVEAWDTNRSLADDGLNSDAGAGDRLYARTVILAAGKAPQTNQMLFFQLVTNATTGATVSFPYIFPAITLNAITGQYTAQGQTVTMVGSPFGNEQAFSWSISVFQTTAGQNTKVYSSPTIAGSTTTFSIPTGTTTAGQSYKFKITAQVGDRVPGYPAYVIESPMHNLAETATAAP